MGHIDAGDWMRFAPVSIATAGTYTVDFRVATPQTEQQLVLANAETGEVLKTVALPNTGDGRTGGRLPRRSTCRLGRCS